MPIKGTIQVQLSQAQADEAARWLAEYTPVLPSYHMPDVWESEQRQLAAELSQILHKAAIRKRSSTTLNLRIRCELAQWFATFARDDGWWDFDGVQLPSQPAPEHIQAIATVFLRAASRRRGRPLLTLLDTVEQLERGVKAGADPRVVRRLRNETKPEREWEKKEIDAADPEPDA
jgi:hypothetical protein